MPKYEVIAEFIDAKTGDRIPAGETIEASGKRVDALRKAGVIGEEVKESKPSGKGSKKHGS